MRFTYFRAISLSLAVLALSACEQLPGAGPSVVVVDYAAVAKATGQEEFIQQKLQAAGAWLSRLVHVSRPRLR